MTRQNFHKIIDQADSKVYKTLCESVASEYCFYEDNFGKLRVMNVPECDQCPYDVNGCGCYESLVDYLMEGENEVVI